MRPLLFKIVAVLVLLWGLLYLTQRGAAGPATYSGMCDASAVVSLDHEFFAVGDDEETVIRVYSRLEGGRAVHALNVAPFLGLPRRAAEVDLEGSARLGNRIYWISSHGCNAEGKEQPSRRRFFATTGSINNGIVDVRPVGQPYAGLLDDLIRDPRLASFQLAAASRRTPKAPDALNIEGLGATPEGHLLIGFRNPIPGGKALLVPMLNPAAVVDGTERPRFGDPILIDLGGLGIRSIAWRRGCHWIVAGSHTGEGQSLLYQWHGGADRPRPMAFPELAGLNPEAITFFAEASGDQLWVVSDDGTVKVGKVECKRLKDSRLKRFRALSIPLPDTVAASR